MIGEWLDCGMVKVLSGLIAEWLDTGRADFGLARPGGRDLNSGGGPCAVIEGSELLMREHAVCANTRWITRRARTEPD